MMQKKFFIILFGVVMAVAAPAAAGIIMTAEGTVSEVNLKDPVNPEITILSCRNDSGEKTLERLKVCFKTDGSGCIDWQNPENREKGLVFGLVPGNVIDARVRPTKQDAQFWEVISLKLIAAESDTMFKGMEKITAPSLMAAFQSEPKRTGVIILLAGHKTLSEQILDPKTRENALSEIKELQKQVINSVPASEFEPGQILQTVPVISGKVTLPGLKAFAANPLVESIEPDMPAELHQSEPSTMR